MFKTWTRDGTPATHHRTDVLNRAADIGGMKAFEAALAVIGAAERITGSTANRAIEVAATA